MQPEFSPDMRLPVLWTDTPNAMDRLQALQATCAIDPTEANDLAHLIEHGWLIWRKAMEDARVADLVRDLQDLSANPGHYIAIDSGHGRRLNGPDSGQAHGFADLYVNIQSSRQLCMHWKIARFLSLVFQAKPLAFQQTLWRVSPSLAWHRDPAYIVVDSPMLLAGTWIALEDAAEGDIAFYDKSHRLPPYVFANGRLHHDDQTSVERYARDLEAACRARQLPYCRLHARKGDVFFWTAGLVHHNPYDPGDNSAGSAARRAGDLACVTHYCPATSTPHWFADPALRGIEPFFDLGGFASAHYRLPNLSRVIRPIPDWGILG